LCHPIRLKFFFQNNPIIAAEIQTVKEELHLTYGFDPSLVDAEFVTIIAMAYSCHSANESTLILTSISLRDIEWPFRFFITPRAYRKKSTIYNSLAEVDDGNSKRSSSKVYII
jgi:hypothetical protein